jgi:hypothetical protein
MWRSLNLAVTSLHKKFYRLGGFFIALKSYFLIQYFNLDLLLPVFRLVFVRNC